MDRYDLGRLDFYQFRGTAGFTFPYLGFVRDVSTKYVRFSLFDCPRCTCRFLSVWSGFLASRFLSLRLSHGLFTFRSLGRTESIRPPSKTGQIGGPAFRSFLGGGTRRHEQAPRVIGEDVARGDTCTVAANSCSKFGSALASLSGLTDQMAEVRSTDIATEIENRENTPMSAREAESRSSTATTR